ncbi:c-type cytochrome [Hymenobacter arizonensis]|uniref:Cytochrome C oxidase, cbb3-type, subunit III n=1 Tax=Hymenobacter arizonensis TaxID=1227077 RepID=A0A1I5WVS6_HYMAR|nr:cytochrome c [Hymenobacter arizonensis]SFQ23728.1 Cytochrome C oxidase, cbb3-type, subunit III [Hymenobacter arizonensis]
MATLLRPSFRLLGALAGLLAQGCTYAQGPPPGPCNDAAAPTYAAVIAPLVAAQCLECHGAAVNATQGGGLDFSTYRGFTNQSAAYLMSSVRHEPGAAAMPKGRAQLSDCDIARLQAWIDAGWPNN